MNDISKYTMNLPEEEYHAYPCMSYSIISGYLREGMRYIRSMNEQQEDTKSLRIGTLVDNFMTDKDNFFEKYCVNTASTPTPKLKAVMDYLYDEFGEDSLDNIDKDDIVASFDIVEYKSIKDPQKRLAAVYSAEDYYNMLSSHKIVVSMEDYNIVQHCVESLNNNQLIHYIFDDNTNKRQVLFQQQFKSVINDIEYKIMIDVMHIIHDEHKIILFDLKTSKNSADEFAESYVKWNYWVQQSLYVKVLRNALKNTDFADYEIEWGGFIVVSTTDYTALCWNCSLEFENGLCVIGEYEFEEPTLIAEHIKDVMDSGNKYDNDIDELIINDLKPMLLK